MLEKKIVINSKFLKVFSEDELKDIMDNATSISADCIVIATENNYFELSADVNDELDIHCDEHNNLSARKLSKDEFMTLYKSSPLMSTVKLSLNE
ncbi:hypothetical protein MN086_06335 [Sulfurovum sp. XGS-02]|uniref:hypothetical protein n=1 Tax=Sulfurovum sp. XGS-02 TaxID=2925411 RepID=UPI00204FC035|nr:hypothetical protein [Sulfurovum sp. XGS-02]UPT76670.1 hypothetical protein MN086_06335 [Sulfurovum sp. XGS-02]